DTRAWSRAPGLVRGHRARDPGLGSFPREKGQMTAHDRAVAAFGQSAQARLDALEMCFVGAGGLGWEVAALVRRISDAAMTFIDPDQIEESNLPRLAGSTPSSIGSFKAMAAAEQFRREQARTEAVVGVVEDVP